MKHSLNPEALETLRDAASFYRKQADTLNLPLREPTVQSVYRIHSTAVFAMNA